MLVRHSSVNEREAVSRDTRSLILDHAFGLIEDEGVMALTVENIAHACGVSKGGVLYHFRHKDRLVSALLRQALGDCLADTSEPACRRLTVAMLAASSHSPAAFMECREAFNLLFRKLEGSFSLDTFLAGLVKEWLATHRIPMP